MRFFTIILLVAITSNLSVYGQNEHLSGQVIDESGNPVPFAHVRIGGTYSGTLTNIHGNFQLNVSSRETTQLMISCVGYVSQPVDIPATGSLTITLKEDLINLETVVVVPKNYAKELVIKAINQIPSNYPNRGERITGFIRETLSKDSLASDLHYISEAQTEISKSGYEKPTLHDEVKLLKGRKLNIDTANMTIRIYAGAHLPHRFDMVLRREGPLNPKKTDEYIYEMDDTVRFENNFLFNVGFVSLNGQETGTISILDQSYAIVALKRNQTKDAFKGANILKANKRQYLTSLTNYDLHEDSKWRLNYIQYSTGFRNGSRDVYLNSVYTSHGFQIETEKISYQDRIQFGDYLHQRVDEFQPTYWSGYNITLPDQRFDQAYQKNQSIQSTTNNENSQSLSILDIIKRVEFGYNARMIKWDMNPHSIIFNQGEINLNEIFNDDELVSWNMSTSIMYRLKNYSYLFFESGRSFGADKIDDVHLGYNRRFPITRGRRLFIAGSLGYSYTQFNKSIGQIALSNSIELDGKKIDASRLDVYSTSKIHTLFTSFTIIYEKSRRLKFQTGIDFFSPIGGSNGARFIEDQGIFRRKNVFLENGMNGIEINSSNSLNFERRLGLRCGLIVSF